MKTVLIVLGVVVLALSGIALANRGISYTREEQIIDMGPIQASAETRETFHVPVWASVLGLAVGAGLVVAGTQYKG